MYKNGSFGTFPVDMGRRSNLSFRSNTSWYIANRAEMLSLSDTTSRRRYVNEKDLFERSFPRFSER